MSNSKEGRFNAHNLRSINIQNLFGTDINTPCTNGKLDIDTLFKKNTKDTDYQFDSDVLLLGVKRRKKKLLETHTNIYKQCCEIITKASDAGMTDLLFEVPDNVFDCIDYSPHECLKHIRDKLAEQQISCYIKSKKKIFITWHSLEEKLSKREEEMKKIEEINTLNNNNYSSSDKHVNEDYYKYTN